MWPKTIESSSYPTGYPLVAIFLRFTLSVRGIYAYYSHRDIPCNHHCTFPLCSTAITEKK